MEPGAGREDGVGLVELVIAVTLLAMVMLGMAAAMGGALRLVGSNRMRVVAANLASQEIEGVRSVDFSTLPIGRTEKPKEVDGTDYRVVVETEWLEQDSGVGACVASTGGQDFLRVGVRVTWDNMGAVQPVESQTLLSPTGAAFDAEHGGIAVAVTGGRGLPTPGVTVTLAGGPTAAAAVVTPASGCAHFANLEPGTYTVSLARTGYVDGQGDAAPQSGSVGVSAGLTTPVPLKFDQAATLALSFESAPGYATPLGLPVTLGNNQLQPSGIKTVPGAATSREVGDLFPWDAGYSAWAGQCADADPQGVVPDSSPTQRYYPTATRESPLTASRGAITTGTVVLRPVQISVQRAGAPAAGVALDAVHADPSACGGAPALRLSLGTSDASGVIQVGLPYGSWRFEPAGGGAVSAPAAATLVTPASGPLGVVVVP